MSAERWRWCRDGGRFESISKPLEEFLKYLDKNVEILNNLKQINLNLYKRIAKETALLSSAPYSEKFSWNWWKKDILTTHMIYVRKV